MSEITNLRNILERQKGQKMQIVQSIGNIKIELKQQKIDLQLHEQAREIIKEIGLKTQQQLSFHISDITSLALEAVFTDAYKLIVDFVQRRNKTECDLYFDRDGNRVHPLMASGGGAVDIAAFALRIASWSMQSPKSRNVIILDEPMRFVSKDLQEKTSKMIKELSEKLNLQFIVITHEATLTEYADKIFQVSIKNGVSQIK
jgi:DNA repair exonuclease SbcCD ATPase subunit